MRLIILLLGLFCYTQTLFSEDIGVIIHQNMLNKFLVAAGPVSDVGETSVMGKNVTYTWTVQKPTIQFSPGEAKFIADAHIDTSLFDYTTPVTGDVDIVYNPKTNLLNIVIKKATFELYTKIFGKKISFGDVDISRFYKPKFEFPGPEPVQSEFELDFPSGKKTLYVTTSDPKVTIKQDYIHVVTKVDFSELAPENSIIKN